MAHIIKVLRLLRYRYVKNQGKRILTIRLVTPERLDF